MRRVAMLGAGAVLLAACAQIFGLDSTHRDDGDGGPPIDGGGDDDDDGGGPDDAGVDAPLIPCGVPDDTEPCYTGPDGTLGNGPCEEGIRTCLDTGFWGPCEDQVLPQPEICNNGQDEDCSGVPDDVGGEGSIDFPGNGIDDDCDGTEDNVVPSCDEGLLSNSTELLDYARALGQCVVVPEDSTDWGVISVVSTLADGTGVGGPNQSAIRPALGATTPREGVQMLMMSTGNAAGQGQLDPPYVLFESGTTVGTMGTLPADWLAANGGAQPNAPICKTLGTVANDPTMLTMRLRVPTNARAFRMRTNYFSTDYPEWVCSMFNDMFVVLLDSAATSNPPDKNLAVVTGSATLPFTANVSLAGPFLRVCQNQPAGCASMGGTVTPQYLGCVSDAELIGSGFDVQGMCGTVPVQFGGGTGWMITQGNVVGGEVITLRLAIWDNGDQAFDSMALIDAFEWLPEEVVAGSVPDV